MTLAIPAVVLTQPAPRHRAGEPLPPAAGELLQLTLEGSAGEDMLFRTVHGLALRLAAMQLGRSLMIGDTLLMRVQATAPQLVLSPVDTMPPALQDTGTALDEAGSMRSDQLAMRQFSWARPDAAWIAATWRTQVLQAVQPAPATLAALPPAVQIPGGERWHFPLFGWGGAGATLHFAEPEAEDPPPPRRVRRSPALRLELELPQLGRVVIHLQLLGVGVWLVLWVEQDSSLPVARSAVPAIAHALAGGGLPLHRFRVERRTPHLTPPASWLGHAAAAAESVPPVLFRAAADVMLVLVAECGETGPLAARSFTS